MKDITYKFLKSKGDRFEFCYADKTPFLVSGIIDVKLMEEYASQQAGVSEEKMDNLFSALQSINSYKGIACIDHSKKAQINRWLEILHKWGFAVVSTPPIQEERKDNTCEVCKKDKYLTPTTPDKGLCVCQSHPPKSEVVSEEDIKWLKEANESLIYARPYLTHISYPNHNLVEKLSKWMPKKKCRGRECSVDISDEDDDVILCGDCYLDATNGKTD